MKTLFLSLAAAGGLFLTAGTANAHYPHGGYGYPGRVVRPYPPPVYVAPPVVVRPYPPVFVPPPVYRPVPYPVYRPFPSYGYPNPGFSFGFRFGTW